MNQFAPVWSIRPIDVANLDSVNVLLAAAELPLLTATGGVELKVWGSFVSTQLMGSAALETHGRCGLLRALVVAQAGRGRGIGASLVARVEERARYDGLRSLYLLTTTAADFFSALSYRRVERPDVPAEIRASEEFTHLCPASALCFFKRLAS